MNSALTRDRIGSYTLQRLLSESRQGARYEGLDFESGQRVTVQVFPAAAVAGGSGWWGGLHLKRLASEAQALQHPNIVRVIDAAREGDAAFVVTEWVDGDRLPLFLARTQRLPTLHGLALVLQLLSALEFAHRHDQVHGAIEPGQLIVEPCGRLRVAGFGVPALLPGHAASVQTDLYSAAVVAHLLLCGEMPGGECVRMPSGLHAVFARALAAEPERRFADAAALSAALRDAVGEPTWDPQQRQVAAPVAKPAAETISKEPVPAMSVPKASATWVETADIWQLASSAGPDPEPEVPVRQADARVVRRRPFFIAAGLAALLVVAALAVRQEGTQGPLDIAGVDAHEEVIVERPSQAVAQVTDVFEPSRSPAMPSSTAETTGTPPALQVAAAPPVAENRPAPQRMGAAPELKSVRAEQGRRAAPLPARRGPALRTASLRRGNDLGCQQDFAFTREVCTALRCVTVEFRRHPTCMRLSAHQRAVNAQRELLGGH